MDRNTLMAAFAPVAAARTPEPAVPDGWIDTGRTKNGKPIYRVHAIIHRVQNPVVSSLVDRLPKERPEHRVGDTCPHCLGSGRYSAHRGHFNNEKCFRCDGKGVLNAKDLAYLRRREVAKAPVCRVVSA